MLKKTLTFVALTLVLSACSNNSTSTTAESPANSDAVKVRQDLMQDWRGSMDILKGMQENPANFNADLAKEQANFLAESSTTMWGHFADANAKGGSQDTVWSNPTGFQTAADNFKTAVTALQAASQNATELKDIDSAIGAVGESCGSCHKDFKQK